MSESVIGLEIANLQKKLELLEQKQQEFKIEKETNNVDHNLQRINKVLTEKRTAISQNRYSKSLKLARYYDVQLVEYLEAIYNTLRTLNDRVNKLESAFN
jgi:hypothetical protein